jgi:hypothetical protein
LGIFANSGNFRGINAKIPSTGGQTRQACVEILETEKEMD